MTVLDLDAILARAEAATAGPWFAHAEMVSHAAIRAEEAQLCYFGDDELFTNQDALDAAFTAAARTEHPAAWRALREIAERHSPCNGFTAPTVCRECGLKWPYCPDYLSVVKAVEEE